MKSSPLVVCVTGSFAGGCVSTAICLGPGASALRFALGAAGSALAATGGVNAAALASVAPLRKLRRPIAGELSWGMLGFDMGFLSMAPGMEKHRRAFVVVFESRAPSVGRQGGLGHPASITGSRPIKRAS